ncbi:hypothetical protein RND81_13G201000 [Saponaria officinalis]|uniref:LOB domain-containing protein n=1 Tax=Saponaria officinalis TaxID=3572 RepID=A0AAW1H001_SAPOF
MSSNSPCAACKFLRRKCTQECVFAPYFPPDQPQRFANVHKVFGASNVAKLLNELAASQREDAVNSLAYEAEARLRDPVYGCVGLISLLQQRLKQVQTDLITAKKELATYMGPASFMAGPPMFPPPPYNAAAAAATAVNANVLGGYNMANHMMGIATNAVGPSQQHQQHQQQNAQQLIEAQQQMAAVMKEEQEMMRNWEQQQQFMRFNAAGGSGGGGGFCGTYEVGGEAVVTAAVGSSGGGGGFNQMVGSPSLALGGGTYDQNAAVYTQLQQPQHGDEDEPLGQLLLLQQPEPQQPPPPQQQQQQQQHEVVEVAQAIPLLQPLLEQHHHHHLLQQQQHHLILHHHHHHEHDHQHQHQHHDHDHHQHHHHQRTGSEEDRTTATNAPAAGPTC